VALARAMVVRPRVLFADEPTGNLDTETGAEVAELLFALPERTHTTLFLVTHEETLARRCKRIVKLKDGAIVSDTASENRFRSHGGWRAANCAAGSRLPHLLRLSRAWRGGNRGVDSIADALLAGLAEHGRALLGGDVAVELVQRPMIAAERDFVAARARSPKPSPCARWPMQTVRTRRAS